MTPALAAGTALLAAFGAWELARRAGRAQRLTLGRLPVCAAAAAAAVAALAASRGDAEPSVCAVLGAANAAAVADRRCGAIFDRLTLALGVVAIALAASAGALAGALRGGAIVGGALWALYALTGRRGIGLGDVKLAAGIGAGLGLERGGFALATAFVIGGAYGAWLLLTRRATSGMRLRFGPFVAAGTAVAVLVPGTSA